MRCGETPHALQGFERPGLVGQMRGQPGDDLDRPGIAPQGRPVSLNTVRTIRGWGQPRHLLTMGGSVAPHHITGRLC